MPNDIKHIDANGNRIGNSVFRAIADYTYDWESWHSPDGRLLWVNAAVERMTGHSWDECLKMRIAYLDE